MFHHSVVYLGYPFLSQALNKRDICYPNMERERPVYQMYKETTEEFLASLDHKLTEEDIRMQKVIFIK